MEDDTFSDALYFLMMNCMTNDASIYPLSLNKLSMAAFTQLLEKLECPNDAIELAVNIKNETLRTNSLDHQAVIDLFSKYNHDVRFNSEEKIDILKILEICTKNNHNFNESSK